MLAEFLCGLFCKFNLVEHEYGEWERAVEGSYRFCKLCGHKDVATEDTLNNLLEIKVKKSVDYYFSRLNIRSNIKEKVICNMMEDIKELSIKDIDEDKLGYLFEIGIIRALLGT